MAPTRPIPAAFSALRGQRPRSRPTAATSCGFRPALLGPRSSAAATSCSQPGPEIPGDRPARATATPTWPARPSPCPRRRSSTRPHRDPLHAGPARRRSMPESLDLRLRAGDIAAARPAAEGPGLPGAPGNHDCPTCSSICRARSTSACAGRPKPSAGGCATPSTWSPTCRSPSSP